MSVTCASRSPGGASGPNGSPRARPAGRTSSDRVAGGFNSSHRSNRRPTAAETAAPGSLADADDEAVADNDDEIDEEAAVEDDADEADVAPEERI